MANKSEIIGEFIITEDDNGSFSVNRIYKSTMKALKEIWEGNGKGEAPKNWNTQDLGRHILNDICGGVKEATIGEYTIEREKNERINLIRNYSNPRTGLKDCAESIKFKYDDAWTDRQLFATMFAFYQTLQSDKK